MYDVVIVGAGPAGSTTARFASLQGLNVLLLDRKNEIGHPVQCGEFLPSLKEMKEIAPRSDNMEELFELEDQISKRTRSIRFFTPKKKCYELEFDGFSVERRSFDKYLVEKAVAEGTELRTGIKVTGIKGSEVLTDDGVFSAKVIVGADGPSSKVAGWSGLESPSRLSRCVLCEIPGDFPATVDMHFGSTTPGGYAWVIPKKGSANIGLGVQGKSKKPLKSLLLDFLKANEIEGEPNFWSAGFVPVSGPVSKTVKGNVLLVGDAAGHVMATNGGGIPIAMICGRIAGNIIAAHLKNNVPLAIYEEEWRRVIGKELETALKTKKMVDMLGWRDFSLEIAMKFMGRKRMNKAVKCKPIFGR